MKLLRHEGELAWPFWGSLAGVNHGKRPVRVDWEFDRVQTGAAEHTRAAARSVVV